jgi:hypothetical protein
VDQQNPQQLLGYLSRAGVVAARKKRFNEEFVRESGWLIIPSLGRSRNRLLEVEKVG